MSLIICLQFIKLSVIVLIISNVKSEEVPYIVNLDAHCLRCLCYAATGCNLTTHCEGGYCGPYKIAKLYWKDAGEIILPDDDPRRDAAYEDCAVSYNCAQRIIKNYMVKYGRDCNGDGRTDCDDYSMINFNGGYHCQTSLQRDEAGRSWSYRYTSCFTK